MKKPIDLAPRLDWLTVIGDLPDDFFENESRKENALQLMKELLLTSSSPRHQNITDGVENKFLNNQIGVQINILRKPQKRTPYIKVLLKGHFFLGTTEEIDQNVKQIIRVVWENLHIITPPKCTIIDIAIDRLGKSVDKSLPPFRRNNYEMRMKGGASTPKLKIKQYSYKLHGETIKTGHSYSTSRFIINNYDRRETLNEDQRSITYIQYYEELYEGYEHVSRVELRLKKESKIFNQIYFTKQGLDLASSLTFTLAHFYKNHRFYYKDKPINQYEKLFKIKDYTPLKKLKEIYPLKEEIQSVIKLKNARSKNAKAIPSRVAKELFQLDSLDNEMLIEYFIKILDGIKSESWSYLKELQNLKKAVHHYTVSEEAKQDHIKELDKMEKFIRSRCVTSDYLNIKELKKHLKEFKSETFEAVNNGGSHIRLLMETENDNLFES